MQLLRRGILGDQKGQKNKNSIKQFIEGPSLASQTVKKSQDSVQKGGYIIMIESAIMANELTIKG